MNIYRNIMRPKGLTQYELVKEPSPELRAVAQEVFEEHANRRVPREERSRPIVFTPGIPRADADGKLEELEVYTIFEPRP